MLSVVLSLDWKMLEEWLLFIDHSTVERMPDVTSDSISETA